MHPHPRGVLGQLIADHGPGLLNEPARVNALLVDLCGSYHRERFLLVHALRERISVPNRPDSLWLGSCAQRLQKRYCFSAEAAAWAAESWSESLNIAPSNQKPSRKNAEIDKGINISLSDSPQGVLGRLLSEYGPALLKDPLRVDALLADFCNPHSAERFLLVHTLREDIPVELLSQEQGGDDHAQQLSQRLQSRYGFHIEAVEWALRSWALALKVARSSQDPIAKEAAKAHAEAVANARLTAQKRAAADKNVRRQAEECDAAEETVRLKKRERDAADATVRTLAQERAAAEETARFAADDWVAAKALARSTAAEVEGIMLHVLNNRPMTSSEVADILDKEQEQAITWLRQLQEAGKVEFLWLERSPHYPCYRGKVDANVLAATEDIGGEIGAEVETAARARAKELISAQATVREHSKEKAVADTRVLEKTEDWLASEAKALEKAKKQTVAEAAVCLREQEHAVAVAEARLKAEEQAVAEKIASKRKEERTAAEAAANQKRREWLAAEATARQKVEERLAAAKDDDGEILIAFYHATNGANWLNRDNWLSDAPLDTWHGVVTGSSGCVVRLSLRNNQLSGSIPPKLGNLNNLEYLSLGNNQLSGPIPSELGNLNNLEYLSLGNNQLSGSIPSELGNLNNLEYLYLRNNQLSGPIPSELGNLNNLKLNLRNNQLSGSTPPAPDQRQLSSHSRVWLGVLWLWLGTMALVVLPMMLLEVETTVGRITIVSLVAIGITAGLVGLIGMLWLWCGRMLMRMMGMKDSLSPRANSWVGLFWLWAGAMGLVGMTGTFEPAIGLAGLGVGLIGMFWLWLGRVLQRLFGFR